MPIYKYNHPLRKAPRAQVEQSAYIADDDGKPLCPCLMIDVSSGGAKLQIEATVELPATFILVLSKDGLVRRPCKPVWRGPKTVGVQFLKPVAKPTSEK
jgi:hypothetical protein